MKTVAVMAIALAAVAAPAALSAQRLGVPGTGGPVPTLTDTTLTLDDGVELRYGISIPNGVDPSAERDRPLVLALHPGGSYAYYGSEFMRGTIEPGLRAWGAVIIAPDVLGRSWTTERSEGAVLELIEHVMAEHRVDRDRIFVAGFSMGGRGAWHLAARHGDLFAGAIVIAGSPGDTDVADLSIPLYLIHSPDDEVVPFERAESAYRELAGRGHPVEMRVLPGAGHYGMGAYVPALRAAGDWMLAR